MAALVFVLLLYLSCISAQFLQHPPSDASYTQPSYRMIGESFTFTCKQIRGYSHQLIYLWNSAYRYTDGSNITSPFLCNSDYGSQLLAPSFPNELRRHLTVKSGSENGLKVWNITVRDLKTINFALYGCYNRHEYLQRTTLTELRKFEPGNSSPSLRCSRLEENSAGSCICESTGANPAPNFRIEVDGTGVNNSTDNMEIYTERVPSGVSRAMIQWRSVPRDIKKITCDVIGPGGTSWRRQISTKLVVQYEPSKSQGGSGKISSAVIAAIAVGVLVVIAVVVVVVVILRRRGPTTSKAGNQNIETLQKMKALQVQVHRLQIENRQLEESAHTPRNQGTGQQEALYEDTSHQYQDLLRRDERQNHRSAESVNEPKYVNCPEARADSTYQDLTFK